MPLRRWRSPRTGIEYPVEWRLHLSAPGAPSRQLRLVPLFDDQELDSRRSTGALYWEGAVRLIEEGAGEAGGEAGQRPGQGVAMSSDMREIGRGYLEMTGYAGRLELQ